MQLTLFSDYALRVLIFVGTKGDEELSTITDISKHYGISKNHLIKVVHRLGMTGYLSTVQGKGGGFGLAKPPSEIRIGDVIRDTENHFNIAQCFDPSNLSECAIEPACRLKHLLNEALQAFLSITDNYTLADLIRPRASLQKLLKMSA